MRTLYSIHHSPWSERARFALLHHEVDFREKEHVPLVGEIPLRFRTGKWSGKISVPLLIDDGKSVQGSLAIAEHLDAYGKGTPLVPNEKRAEISAFFDEIEDGMCASRERFTHALQTDRAAQQESAPGFLRAIGMAGPAVWIGSRFIVSKYNANDGSVEERIRKALTAVRTAVGKKDYVLNAFTFADIVAASLVQSIAPFDQKFLAIPPATRKLWHHDGFAKEFADVIAWRDRLYEKHRVPESKN
ncbi:MAG: glutathione S-transferase [Polyangiaceae bacterium]